MSKQEAEPSTVPSPQESAIVVPPLKTPEIIEKFKQIQALKASLLDKSDFAEIQGRLTIKRTGWTKLRFAFNISDEIVKEEREVTPEGETIWRTWVKTIAPNGRTSMGTAAASTKERKFAHESHDPYALCHTRALNRATSNILGLGEVSFEEMTEGIPFPIQQEPREEKSQKETALPGNAKLERTDRGLGFQEWMIKCTACNEIVIDETKEVCIEAYQGHYEITHPQGQFSVRIPLEFPIKQEESPFESFFIGRILSGMTRAHPQIRYELVKDDQEFVTEVSFNQLTDEQRKEIENTLAWTLKQVKENREKAQK